MEDSFMLLTETDKQILNSYAFMLEGLGSYLGAGYELVLHSLESLDSSVIKIINGQLSGRREGAPITDLALRMLSEFENSKEHKVIPYYNANSSGASLRSCTIPIMGENKRIIGLLCMNFHMELPLSSLLQGFAFPSEPGMTSSVSENFSDNIDDLILTALNETREHVFNDPSISSANRNKDIVLILYQKGIFNLKDSVIKVAKQLNISKNTVYMHIRNHKNTDL